MIAKRWIVRVHDTDRAVSLARLLGTSQILAALLISRGCADEASARVFLQPSYDQSAADILYSQLANHGRTASNWREAP